jgi:hypothetical protein
MKFTIFQKLRFSLLSAILFGMLPMHAADSIEAQWADVCRISQNHTLTVTTEDGKTVEGLCVMVNVNEISIQTDHGLVNVARSALKRIEMATKLPQRKGHELRRLGHGMRDGLRQGTEWLFSTSAPLGMVTIPGTLAWGAISAPFCALSDLHDKIAHSKQGTKAKKEIKVL